MNYPEHAKLKQIAPYSQKIMEFLEEFCVDQGFYLCKEVDMGHREPELEYTTPKEKLDLIAEFFDIDRQAVELEKIAMLGSIREVNKELA